MDVQRGIVYTREHCGHQLMIFDQWQNHFSKKCIRAKMSGDTIPGDPELEGTAKPPIPVVGLMGVS